MIVDIQPHPDYLLFVVTGKYNLNVAIDKFALVITACLHNGLYKALIDYRQLEGESFASLDVLYAHHAAEMVQKHRATGGTPIKIAFLGKREKPWTFGQEIAKQQGIEVLITQDFPEAVAWLIGKSEKSNLI